MARPRKPRPLQWGIPVTHSAFKPYVTALGQLTLAWNELHERMSLLFCTVMGGGYANQFLAIWHTINSDRNQRSVLAAAVENDLNRSNNDATHKYLIDEIRWICGQVNTLENLRNDALHSPLIGFGPHITPMTGLGHLRAQKLESKSDFLAEFRWCRDAAVALTEYVYMINASLSIGRALPDRPKLPPLDRLRGTGTFTGGGGTARPAILPPLTGVSRGR